jgi:NAD(P)-dependent dehydrogenase (short-subunit alcohol dehydrogenase family)
MPTVLITGANRGIGLEFARQYATDGWTVIATAREPSAKLEELGVRIETLDMCDTEAVVALGRGIGELDLLIANAGTYGPRDPATADDAAAWGETFAINTIAPFLLAKAVLPAVERSGGKLVAITSKMGSVDDNGSGGFVAYRSSKSALNMAWKSLAVDNPAIPCAVLHPGWVQTRMGGASAPLPAEASVAGMRRVIEGLGPDRSGGFFSYDGSEIPW